MKTIINRILLTLFIAGVLAGCKRDFLDVTPLGEISSQTTWADGALSTAFVTNLYNGFGPGGFDEQMLASLSDEAVFTHTGRGITTVNDGSLSPSTPGWVHSTYEWGNMYSRIRGCNVSIQNLGTATFDDDDLKDRLKGEAYFMRAYFYHQLVRYYGGVPIIKNVYGLNEDYSIERSSFSDCVNFIVSDCDSAALLLAGRDMDKGRASEVAALGERHQLLAVL